MRIIISHLFFFSFYIVRNKIISAIIGRMTSDSLLALLRYLHIRLMNVLWMATICRSLEQCFPTESPGTYFTFEREKNPTQHTSEYNVTGSAFTGYGVQSTNGILWECISLFSVTTVSDASIGTVANDEENATL